MNGNAMVSGGDFWRGKRVFLTGHTGFKGSWLTLWLARLGAEVWGYALAPPTEPSLFDLAGVRSAMAGHTVDDIRHMEALRKAIAEAKPDVVFHMAAQPLVRESYRDPSGTYATNVIGTVNLLEAVRRCEGVRAVVNVTTDKCYENREWTWGYRENEPLGGVDPYSSSKACSELVTASWRRSFFAASGDPCRASIASARAGNVIGGGDFAPDRLLPDCVRAVLKGEKILLRNPGAVRPWQHVLEPLAGYLMLGRRLFEQGEPYASPWNFGPEDSDARPVEWIVRRFCEEWGEGAAYGIDAGTHPHEAQHLKLDISKARSVLGWSPTWNLPRAVSAVVEWTRIYREGGNTREECLRQIGEYESSAGIEGAP